jgi:hypothetical protein
MLVALSGAATPSNCGEPLKGSLPNQCLKEAGGQVNSLGYGKNASHVTMGNPQPSPYTPPLFRGGMGKVQRLDGGGFAGMSAISKASLR